MVRCLGELLAFLSLSTTFQNRQPLYPLSPSIKALISTPNQARLSMVLMFTARQDEFNKRSEKVVRRHCTRTGLGVIVVASASAARRCQGHGDSQGHTIYGAVKNIFYLYAKQRNKYHHRMWLSVVIAGVNHVGEHASQVLYGEAVEVPQRDIGGNVAAKYSVAVTHKGHATRRHAAITPVLLRCYCYPPGWRVISITDLLFCTEMED
ncbi:hypothetical protein J6590_064309 [Homalodisca vitripennis]|nr:hypothetical protein J6590_064309 [Homalodisca vitripennis]